MKSLRKVPLRLWAILPLTLIFSAAVIRLAWDIPYAAATTNKVGVGLAIAAVLIGYAFILRLLVKPGPAKKLKTRTASMGIAAGVAAALVVATIYLVQKIPYSIANISKLVLGLSIATVAPGYLFFLFLIRPSLLEKLTARQVRIGVTTVVTTALITLTIHTIRFLPSPEANHPLSQLLAILLLAALIGVYPLILRYIWFVWRRKEGS